MFFFVSKLLSVFGDCIPSEWYRNEFGMISGCQNLKNGCVFCIKNFDIVKWKIRWEQCSKYLWAMPKFFVFWWKVIFWEMKGHSKNDLFWLRKALRMRIFTCFLGKGHSVIWSFLKKTLGKGAPFGVVVRVNQACEGNSLHIPGYLISPLTGWPI